MAPHRPRTLIVASAAVFAAVSGIAGVALAQPSNDGCAAATPLALGTAVVGTAASATSDGSCTCSPAGLNIPDVYHTFRSGEAGVYTFSLCQGTAWDTVLSIHSFCPATTANQITCDDEACRPTGATTYGWPSTISVYLAPQTNYVLRVSGYDLGAGFNTYRLEAAGPSTPAGACCLANACSIETASVCQLAGGTFFGPLSACLTPARAPRSYSSAAVPAVIPDNLPAGLTRTINVPDSFTVGNVRLTLGLSHTWAGDLVVRLTHAGRSALILGRLRGGLFGTAVNLGGQYVFADDAVRSIWSEPVVIADSNSNDVIPPGLYWASDGVGATVGLAQAFAGSPAAGDWTLTVVDGALGDVGSLTEFALQIDEGIGNICTTPPPPAGACCLGPLAGGLGTTCGVFTQSSCLLNFGTFQGSGTVCGTSVDNPVACCKANFNAVGGVSVQDVFDFLTAWFSGSPTADFNLMSGVTVQDLFDFLTAWFLGCRVQ